MPVGLLIICKCAFVLCSYVESNRTGEVLDLLDCCYVMTMIICFIVFHALFIILRMEQVGDCDSGLVVAVALWQCPHWPWSDKCGARCKSWSIEACSGWVQQCSWGLQPGRGRYSHQVSWLGPACLLVSMPNQQASPCWPCCSWVHPPSRSALAGCSSAHPRHSTWVSPACQDNKPAAASPLCSWEPPPPESQPCCCASCQPPSCSSLPLHQ